MSRRDPAVSKDQLIEEFNTVIAETEHLLQSVATAGGEKVDALRSGVAQNLANAKDRLRGYQDAASGKARQAARATDAYVHEHPWQAIGGAAAVTIIAGVVVGLLLYRR